MAIKTFKPKNRIEETYRSQMSKLFKPFLKALKGIYDPEKIKSITESTIESKTFNKKAEKVAMSMATMVYKDNVNNWRQAARKASRSKEIYALLRKEEEEVHKSTLQELFDRNAKLIKTLPLDVSESVVDHIHKRSLEGVRAEKLAEEIKDMFPKKTKAKANLIARTETSKAGAALNQVRAEKLGYNWYVWRSSKDQRVRNAHDIMDGVVCKFRDPPEPERLNRQPSEGAYNAGEIYNCRCYAEALIDLDQIDWPCKVHKNGKIETMSKNKFMKISGMIEED